MGDLHPLLPEDPERIGVHLLVGRLLEDPAQAVYLGRLPDEDTLRVIRVLEPRPDADPQARERITNELHAAMRVSGAHTARLLEVGWSDDSPYLVREHVEGRSLRETVAADGPLGGDALERLAVGTLTALTAVHLSGLVHGGLTPDTVLLGPDGPRVCDIGLGEAAVSDPGFRAPEHVRPGVAPGGDDARIPETGPGPAPSPAPAAVPGRPADLFAWAATVVYAATGQPPFVEWPETPPEGPADLTSIPPVLRSLVVTCLDGRPEARPDTRAAMLRLLGEQPTEQAPPILAFPSLPGAPGANAPTAFGAPGVLRLPGIPGANAPAALDAPGANVPAVPGVSGTDAPGTNMPGVSGGPEVPGTNAPAIPAAPAIPGVPGANAPTAPDGPGSPGTPGVFGAKAPGVPGTNPPGVPGVPGANAPAALDAPGTNAPGVPGATGTPGVPGAPGVLDVPGAFEANAPGVHAGPLDGALSPAVAPPPAPPAPPLWGTPPLPGSPPPKSGAVIADSVKEQRSGNGFPLMLVAGVGVVALLSGLGLWAAGSYTSLGNAERVAADGKVSSAPATSQWPGQDNTDDPANRVTVPWGTTPTPQVGDVGPLQLSTDVPTLPAPNPVTPPVLMPTLPPPAIPTAIPTAPRTTGKAKGTSKPVAKPTVKPPVAKPTTAAPKPTTKPSATKPPAAKPTTAKPTPAKTTAPPAAKPPAAKPTTAAPKPTTEPPRSNPYSPQQACGAGFSVQQSASFSGGTVYQLYNASTGNNCAVAMKSADVGKATQVWATLEVQGGGSNTDRGNFDYYAGPVTLPGKGKCVRVSGGGPGGSASTNWANCG
ncbi:serine/threonine protein kinase [Streptosporangium subroseum]|uniref:serine/threonine protein kinase n=1 Tax=Streptosporangium subroseum TaxID=106412 RepID=UPI003088D67A|nr:serine/threonine protein kinase [Streptosporangium subroseum]